ncbi:MAG: DoxX family protein [Phycisphaerae bacterium]|nr:DoxX family protein [Phycisphaerae bacterium]
MLDRLLDPLTSAQLLTAAILAILFLQSGLDKVLDFKGNLAWLQGHFAKSPLRGQVTPMLAVITLTECAAGVLAAVGTVQIALSGSTAVALGGAQLSALNLVMLFFGQRLAKDYAGAAGLVPYFILAVGAIILLGR